MERSSNNMCTQLPVMIFSIIQMVCLLFVTFWNQWAVSGRASSSMLGPVWAFKGLWEECSQYMSGQYQCTDFQLAMFDLPGKHNFHHRFQVA